MTLEQLRIFVAVAERLHMSRGAAAQHVSQSAASASVAALEARYDVRLFDRIGRGLALTDAGRVFLPEAKAVLSRAESATQALDDLAGLKRGAIALAASQTVSSYWLPQRMARFAQAYPGLRLSLVVGNTAQVAQSVLDGDVELGFVEGHTDSPALVRAPVGADRIALYAAPGHPLADARVDADDLKGALWVLREPGSGTRSAFELALTSRGVDPAALNIVLELPSNDAVLGAAAAGGLVAAVSELAAGPLAAAGRLTPLNFDLGKRRFELLTHKDRRRSRAAEAFLARI